MNSTSSRMLRSARPQRQRGRAAATSDDARRRPPARLRARRALDPDVTRHARAIRRRRRVFANRPCGPHEQHDQEDQVAGEDAPARRELGADRLRHAEHDAAHQRAPERAEAADDHRLEGEEQLRRAVAGRERRAHAEEHAGDGHDAERRAPWPARRAGGCRCPSARRSPGRRRSRGTRGRPRCGR